MREGPRERRFTIPPTNLTDTQQALADAVAISEASVGLCAMTLDGTQVIAHQAERVFAQASAIKIPLIVELYEQAAAGELSLSETQTTLPEQMVGGCGVLQHLVPGTTQWSLADLAVLMIQHSDNVATNLIIERVGIDRVNQRLKAAGFETIRLRRRMMDLAAREAGLENQASPTEAVRYLRGLFNGKLGSESRLTDDARQEILRVLQLTKSPGPSPLVAALPKGTPCFCKPGMLTGLRTEWGVVARKGRTPYVIAMMATSDDDSRLEPLLRDLARMVDAAFM